MYFADEAVVVTNPEVSSVRDSDRVLGLLSSKTRRAEKGDGAVKAHLLLTRYDPARVAKGEMMKVEDVLGDSVHSAARHRAREPDGPQRIECRHAGRPQ